MRLTELNLRAAPVGSQARIPVGLKNLESYFEEQHAIPERSFTSQCDGDQS